MEPASDRFAGGNVLIYRVGGERYGCPLSAVREVIDLPADESDPLLFEGRAIRVASLGAILGMNERGPVTEVRSVLVVAAATSGDDG